MKKDPPRSESDPLKIHISEIITALGFGLSFVLRISFWFCLRFGLEFSLRFYLRFGFWFLVWFWVRSQDCFLVWSLV